MNLHLPAEHITGTFTLVCCPSGVENGFLGRILTQNSAEARPAFLRKLNRWLLSLGSEGNALLQRVWEGQLTEASAA